MPGSSVGETDPRILRAAQLWSRQTNPSLPAGTPLGDGAFSQLFYRACTRILGIAPNAIGVAAEFVVSLNYLVAHLPKMQWNI